MALVVGGVEESMASPRAFFCLHPRHMKTKFCGYLSFESAELFMSAQQTLLVGNDVRAIKVRLGNENIRLLH